MGNADYSSSVDPRIKIIFVPFQFSTFQFGMEVSRD